MSHLTAVQVIEHSAALLTKYKAEDRERRLAAFNALIILCDPFQER